MGSHKMKGADHKRIDLSTVLCRSRCWSLASCSLSVHQSYLPLTAHRALSWVLRLLSLRSFKFSSPVSAARGPLSVALEVACHSSDVTCHSSGSSSSHVSRYHSSKLSVPRESATRVKLPSSLGSKIIIARITKVVHYVFWNNYLSFQQS